MASVSPHRAATPLYLQITNALIRAMRRGQLAGGSRLPGTARLSAALGVNRKTLQIAYDELMAQGWIEILPRKGAFVASKLPEVPSEKDAARREAASYPRTTSFSTRKRGSVESPPLGPPDSRNLVWDGGFPDLRIAPIAELLREYRSLFKRKAFTKYLGYGHPLGAQYLRETLADFLRDSRGLAISADNVMITRGAQMAFYLTTKLLVAPGDHVAVGDPGYALVDILFREMGAVVDRVPVDTSGIQIDRIAALRWQPSTAAAASSTSARWRRRSSPRSDSAFSWPRAGSSKPPRTCADQSICRVTA